MSTLSQACSHDLYIWVTVASWGFLQRCENGELVQRLDTCQFWPDWRCDSGESKVNFRCKRLGVSPRHCTRAQVCVTWTNRGRSIDMMHMASFTVRNCCRIWQTRRSWEPVLRTRSSGRVTLVSDACRSADAVRKK